MANRIDGKLREAALTALSGEAAEPPGDAALARLRDLGTQLWLDTGNLEEARPLWRREFSALTTNNTLANQVVQTGVLDDVAREAVRDIRDATPGIDEGDLVMELGFVINCHVALRLVRAFGAFCSVELHPSVAEDTDRTVSYAQRYHAVCPERFIIKIPLTPEGYCAVARVRAQGIPVNYTLGFSARQNYLAALVSGPSYVNVFLGRLNAVVADNGLGDGQYVGEKATMATQRALLDLRSQGRTHTLLIAASMRSAAQVADLAGVDVFTMPPKVAKDFLAQEVNPASLASQVNRGFAVTVNPGVDGSVLEPLWAIDERVVAVTDELAARGGVNLTGDDLRAADADHGARLFCRFTPEQQAMSRAEGKIPVIANWTATGAALDDLMTLAALQSFTVDQGALDDRLRRLAAEVV
ncbi:MAG TPA: transaldolase family protein [Chthonomonadales bacterium]|nr:transaldolase family protein [Chthonomonadales bacterium]